MSPDEEKTNRFREITIPGDVLDDERLSDGAKILYGKIARLSYKNGHCWAGNSFLDGTKTGRNASRLIAELKNAGYVAVENEGSKYRKIRICHVESKFKDESTTPNLAGLNSMPDQDSQIYLANSGAVKEDSTSPNLAESNSQPRQKWRSYLANSGDVYLAKNGDRTPLDSTNLNNTAAAASLSPQELKKAVTGVDSSFIFDEAFYTRAAAFMTLHGLDTGYLKWLYRQCQIKNPDSYAGWYFKVFFAENRAEQYKASKQSASPPPEPDVACPACGKPHAPREEDCPACGLPRFSTPEQITLYQKLFELGPEKKEEYFRRQNNIHAECGKDFIRFKSMVSSLKEEFGLTAIS